MLYKVVLPPEALSMSFTSGNRASESWWSVNFSVVSSQVSCVAEVFDFAPRDGTFVWPSVLVHVFPGQGLKKLFRCSGEFGAYLNAEFCLKTWVSSQPGCWHLLDWKSSLADSWFGPPKWLRFDSFSGLLNALKLAMHKDLVVESWKSLYRNIIVPIKRLVNSMKSVWERTIEVHWPQVALAA